MLARWPASAATDRPVAATPLPSRFRTPSREASPGGGQAPFPATPEAPRPRTSDTLGYCHLPLGIPRPFGRGTTPTPWRRGPPGVDAPGVSRSALSYALSGEVPPRRVRGPHRSFPPRTRAVSPSRAPGFHRRLGRSRPPYAARLLPTAHPSPFVPAATGPGSGPRGSPVRPRYHAACRLRYALAAHTPFPPTRFRSSGYSRRGQGFTDPRRAARSRGGVAPPPLQA